MTNDDFFRMRFAFPFPATMNALHMLTPNKTPILVFLKEPITLEPGKTYEVRISEDTNQWEAVEVDGN